MIELISCLGFIAVYISVLLHNFSCEVWPVSINAMTVICIAFIVFGRLFLHVFMDKVWKAKRRYPLLCGAYCFLLLFCALAILNFNQHSQQLQTFFELGVKVAMCTIGLLALVIVKFHDFKERKLYSASYTVFEILDTLLIVKYICLTACVSKGVLAYHPELVADIVINLVLLWIVSSVILHYRPYWQHRRSLIQRIKQLIREGNEQRLIHPPRRDLSKDPLIKEMMLVLNYAPFRVLEYERLVKTVRKLMLEAGKPEKEATELAAGFATVLILNLMKRKHDFSYIPNFWLQRLQKAHGKFLENRRGFLPDKKLEKKQD